MKAADKMKSTPQLQPPPNQPSAQGQGDLAWADPVRRVAWGVLVGSILAYVLSVATRPTGMVDPLVSRAIENASILTIISLGLAVLFVILRSRLSRGMLVGVGCAVALAKLISFKNEWSRTNLIPSDLAATFQPIDFSECAIGLALGSVVVGLFLSVENLSGVTSRLLSEREGLSRQIRQRAWAERDMVQSASQFQKLAETTSAAILIIQGRQCRYANAAAEELFGFSRDELYTIDITHVLSSSFGLVIKKCSLASHQNLPLPQRCEIKVVNKFGQECWIDVSSGRIQFESKPAVVVTCLEVTERKRAEQMSIESRDRFRALVQDSSDVILVLGADRRIRYSSPSAEKLLGIESHSELIGRSFLDLVHPEDRRSTDAFFVELSQGTGRPSLSEVRVARSDGAWRTLEVLANNHLEHPSIRGFVLNSRDITERQELQNQLRQSQKMEALGRLAGGVAHDFNNLLTTILVRSELLEESLSGDVRKRHEICEIRKAGERAAALTRQLLAFSRSEPIQQKMVDLNSVLGDLKKMLQRLIGEDIQFQTRLDAEAGFTRCDPGQLEQIILNLVVNSRDAMPQGGRILIETQCAQVSEVHGRKTGGPPPGEYVQMTVSDTGCGMDRDTIEHIFEPFFTTKEQSKGTGLGLATVYGIVKQTGGHVEVFSEVGVGTTFQVYFPRYEQGEVSEDMSNTGQQGSRGTETILLVEDDDEVRSLARTILERRGYEVLEAPDGKTAVEICKEFQGTIDLMLSDVVMPGMSGPMVFDAVHPIHPETKVLFMSGYTHDAVMHHGFSGTAAAFLEKPFTSQTILRKIRSVLDDGKDDTRSSISAA